MKRIELTQGLYTIVDDQDFETFGRFKWHYHQTGYAFRSAMRNGKKTLLRLHREILRAPFGLVVDHINGNTLDNRRKNLRLATQSQNLANTKRRIDNTSGFKGVSRNGPNLWRATINVNKKQIFLGNFKTKEKAFDAYVKASRKYFGEYASLGF